LKFQEFSEKLISWYKGNYRPLPWRNIRDPYKIWLSEIILQQTRVAQGLPYYKKFVEKYPSIHALASADEQEILRLWQGLGYYSRARNLLKCARQIVNSYNGKFPGSYCELLKLPGVGKYTAAAIASFAFGEKVAVVDGNVYRVLSRLFGIDKDISGSSAHEHFKNLSEQLIPEDQPGLYNQALMEYGATVCSPGLPECTPCIFNSLCYAYENKAQLNFPVKSKKVKVRDRRFFYVLMYNSSGCLMKQRTSKDIWAGMYDLLWIDTQNLEDISAISEDGDINNIMNDAEEIYNSASMKHILSHQRLETSFINIYVDKLPEAVIVKDQQLIFYSWETIASLPKPVLVNNYFKKRSFIS
jgi:A/G-specific adenine glycosylase